MLASTHRLIAEKVYEAVKDVLKVKLNKRYLKYGSVVPDIYPPMARMSHTLDESIDFIAEGTGMITGREIPLSKMGMRTLSLRIGIIIHFISDYFCRMHNSGDGEKDIIAHYRYENELRKYFKDNADNVCMRAMDEKNWSAVNFIKEYITYRHEEYMNLAESMENDMIYSIDMSVGITLSIVRRCIYNSINKAA